MKKEEKKATTKRDIMRELTKKAIKARDEEVKKAKKEMTAPRIPGLNRKTLRKLIKRQKPLIKIRQRREAYKAKIIAGRT